MSFIVVKILWMGLIILFKKEWDELWIKVCDFLILCLLSKLYILLVICKVLKV